MQAVQNFWKYFLFEGIVLFLLGVFALGSPQIMTLSIEMLVGSLLIVGGVVQFVRAYKTDDSWKIISYLTALITMVAGLLVLIHPVIATVTLTLLLAIYFFVEGFLRIIYAMKYWSLVKWRGFLLNGILSVVLGMLIWSGWPDNSLWVLGMYVGIYFLFLGIGMIFLSLQLRKI